MTWAWLPKCGLAWLTAIALASVPSKDYPPRVLIEVEDEALHGLGLTESQALLDLAIGLFTECRVTLGRAAEIARLTQSDLQRELGRRGIPVHYDVEDFRADLRTLAALRSR